MLPTIDLANVIKKAVYGALSAFSSPIVACIAFAAALSAVVATVLTYFTASAFYPSGILQEVTQFVADRSFWSLIGYCIAADVAVQLVFFFVTVLGWIIVFIPGMFVTVQIAVSILETVYASRATVKDVAA